MSLAVHVKDSLIEFKWIMDVYFVRDTSLLVLESFKFWIAICIMVESIARQVPFVEQIMLTLFETSNIKYSQFQIGYTLLRVTYVA